MPYLDYNLWSTWQQSYDLDAEPDLGPVFRLHVRLSYHRAVLYREVKEATLDGEERRQYRGRVSFFKRLTLEKGNVAAQWEDVIISIIP